MLTWKQAYLKNSDCYIFLRFSVMIIFPMCSSTDLDECHADCSRGHRPSYIFQQVPAQQQLRLREVVSDPCQLHYRHFLRLQKWGFILSLYNFLITVEDSAQKQYSLLFKINFIFIMNGLKSAWQRVLKQYGDYIHTKTISLLKNLVISVPIEECLASYHPHFVSCGVCLGHMAAS